ncbi:hypothetical protein PR048_022246 [Dryococelus australis]|uniref:Uncharacterized protein n=1 Tax=Dryococelus australis TaxID=614101 RepID=A0ABQ9H0J1_9NEOP|nr:hypothetical protein PR048_022246 [Dryococelus australis]
MRERGGGWSPSVYGCSQRDGTFGKRAVKGNGPSGWNNALRLGRPTKCEYKCPSGTIVFGSRAFARAASLPGSCHRALEYTVVQQPCVPRTFQQNVGVRGTPISARAEMKGRGNRDIPEKKKRRPAASPGTIPTCESPGLNQFRLGGRRASHAQPESEYACIKGTAKPFRLCIYLFCVVFVGDLTGTLSRLGATVDEHLENSPPTKANRAQSPAGSPDFRKWESCRTMPLVGEFSRGSPVSPTPSFRSRSVLNSTTLIGSQDLAVKSRPNLFIHSLSRLARHCSICWPVNGTHQGMPFITLSKKNSSDVPTRRLIMDRGVQKYLQTLNKNPTKVIVNFSINTIIYQSGATVAKRLARSPPTKANMVQSPAGGNRAGRCCWSAGFLGALPFPHLFILAPLHIYHDNLIGSQDLAVQSHSNLFTHSSTKAVITQTIVAQAPARLPPRRSRFDCRAGSLQIFACGNRAGLYRWSAGFLGDLPFPPIIAFLRCSIPTSITLISSQDLDVKSRPNFFTSIRTYERKFFNNYPKSRRATSCGYNSSHPVWHDLYECLQDIHGDSSPFLLQPFHELSNGFWQRLTSPHPAIQFVPKMFHRVEVGALGGVKRGGNRATPECTGGENGKLPEKTRRPAELHGTISACENPGATPVGNSEAGALPTASPRPPICRNSHERVGNRRSRPVSRRGARERVYPGRLIEPCSRPSQQEEMLQTNRTVRARNGGRRQSEQMRSCAGGEEGEGRGFRNIWHENYFIPIPDRVTPGFSSVGIVPDDSVGRWVFSGISRFPRPCIPALLHSHIFSPSSAPKLLCLEPPKSLINPT